MRIVVAALIVALASVVSRAEDKPAAPAADEVVARVNGKDVKRSELVAAEQSFAQQLAARGRPISSAQMGQFETDVLEELIGRQLVLQEGLKQPVPDLDAKVQAELAKVKKAKGGEEAFVAALKEAKMTEADLTGRIREGMILQNTMENVFKGKTDISADEIQKFYGENKPRFQRPEQVRASHILIRSPADAPQKDKDEKRARMDVIRARLSQGEKFADVAKQVSEDPGSAANGGDLDFFGRGAMVPEFETTAFSLKTNQVSDVVTTQFGYHLILVTDHRPAHEMALEEVKADIERFLKTRKNAEVAQKFVKDLRDAAKIEILLKPAAPPAPSQPPISVTTPPVAAPTK